MRLKDLFHSTQVAVSAGLDVVLYPWTAGRLQAKPGRTLDLSELEDRVLMNAAPAAMVVDLSQGAAVDVGDDVATLACAPEETAPAASVEASATDVAVADQPSNGSLILPPLYSGGARGGPPPRLPLDPRRVRRDA
jgi:hypothetical protein